VRAFVVDAFTASAFSGNPAGVVLLDGVAEDAWMQRVAAEMRHSETAFVRAREDGSYDLRWFTPAAEVTLCGHATLASAHALACTRALGPFVFHTLSGELTARVRSDATVELDFPAKPVTAISPTDQLLKGLGNDAVIAAWANDLDILVEYGSPAEVEALVPDVDALMSVECRGVIVTSRANVGADHDFVSRFFAPRVGIDEDPVTGSAHCALAPFWAERLGQTTMTGVQLSSRGGRVGVELDGDRVRLIGSAVTVIEGELLA
jgi:predicted PhzF superfamily epimerase YddE/YHI9